MLMMEHPLEQFSVSENLRRCNELNDVDQIQSIESQTPTVELPSPDVDGVLSPTLARLIEEVRNEEDLTAHAYNRMHNRHNRSR
jgi:hypothetical protein